MSVWLKRKSLIFFFILFGITEIRAYICDFDDTVCEYYPTLGCCKKQKVQSSIGCGVMPKTSRIYGGYPAKEGELPWMAVLYYRRRNESHCGASIISQRFLLTAAHCVTGEIVKRVGQPWYARLGVQNLSVPSWPADEYFIEQVIYHEDYNEKSTNRASDIGLVKVDRKIYFSDVIIPICLPEHGDNVPIGTKLIVAGWGKTPIAYYSDQKLVTTLRVLDSEVCNMAYPKSKLKLGPEQICTGGSGHSDSCRGDSGNGLFEKMSGKYFVQGIVSYGSNACGNEQWPSISTKVAWFIEWINRAMTVTKRIAQPKPRIAGA